VVAPGLHQLDRKAGPDDRQDECLSGEIGKFFLKRLPGLGSKPGSSQFHLFSHFFTTLPLSHSGSPIGKFFGCLKDCQIFHDTIYPNWGKIQNQNGL
jgi:hypothetical protein